MQETMLFIALKRYKTLDLMGVAWYHNQVNCQRRGFE